MINPRNANKILSIKNESTSLLEAYQVSIFKDGYSDAACIARMIEIYFLNKLRSKGQKLCSLTGLMIPDTEATAEETNLLLSRFEVLCHREEEELSFRQREVKTAEYALKNAGLNVNSRTVSEVKNKNAVKGARDAYERQYHSAFLRQKEQHTRVSLFRGFGSLLLEEAEHIGKNVSKKYLNSFSRPLTSPDEFINVLNDATLVRDVRFILDALCALDNAVEHILKCCAYPNDRYELERGGICRTMAYREYYRAENAILRSVVSDREYAEHAVKFNQLSEHKKKIFRKQ
ncbi:hypothetical protein [Enterobacter hormaechei]|uniref:hypothetical protein n=1 Tax=Enterobacter hormaechei TaxID=158836 RepID=UPI00064B11B1|nr:hypothetical protein [Enterobacter hormaechei]ELC7275634.1 hypothetical protein [Enterobacter hormaechei]ELC7355408.1 hypothetical protein [Enterobacter hormaechei]ELD3420342.1 hypothetical protein [Enterobacter hormaechei]KLR14363.1 hypothetical protein ABF58_05980 [Enterobacter hormaechei subsp. steigerwaltii]KUQ33962.1 hypothetical protein AWI11_21660 [Enterobacter hormaechei subsp. steigerwaltii]